MFGDQNLREINGLGGQPIFWPWPSEVNEGLGHKRTSIVTTYNSVSSQPSDQRDCYTMYKSDQ